MAKIMIDIGKGDVSNLLRYPLGGEYYIDKDNLIRALQSGILFPDNPTNGDMLTTLYPNAEVSVFRDDNGKNVLEYEIDIDEGATFTAKWWEAPFGIQTYSAPKKKPMARAEAIKVLSNFKSKHIFKDEIAEALQIAISSLKTDEAYQLEYEERDVIPAETIDKILHQLQASDGKEEFISIKRCEEIIDRILKEVKE